MSKINLFRFLSTVVLAALLLTACGGAASTQPTPVAGDSTVGDPTEVVPSELKAYGTFRVGSWGTVILGSYSDQVSGVALASGTTMPTWVTITKQPGFTTLLNVNNPQVPGTYTFDLVADDANIHVSIVITEFVESRSVTWCEYTGYAWTETIPAEFTGSTWTISSQPSWVTNDTFYGTFYTQPTTIGTYTFTAVEKWPLGENDYTVTVYVKEPVVDINNKLLPCTIP